MKKNKLAMAIASLLLSSCASSNVGSSWQCPTPSVKGQKCRNIASADRLAKGIEAKKTHTVKVEKDVIVLLQKNKTSQVSAPASPIRTSEKISRIWFAPFVDKYSNRHEESTVQIVDKNSTWR